MGLFDKIKDNAKNISIKALEDADETENLTVAPETQDESVEDTAQAIIEPTETEEPEKPEETKAEKPAPKQKEDKPAAKEEPVKTKPEDKPKEEKPTKPKETSVATDKPRQPYYKENLAKVSREPKTEPTKKPAAPASKKRVSVIDITPQKIQDPVKREIYARERAAMTALASQRKMNGVVPLYVTNHLNFKTRVFINRIEYSGSFGKNTLPIESVAWVKLRAGGTGVIIETTEGKRVVMVVKPTDRLDFADAVMKVQSLQPKRAKFKDTQTVRIDQLEQFADDTDELEKLARLRDKGILTQEEFDAKKKKILGI